jgi:hypothetical protein
MVLNTEEPKRITLVSIMFIKDLHNINKEVDLSSHMHVIKDVCKSVLEAWHEDSTSHHALVSGTALFHSHIIQELKRRMQQEQNKHVPSSAQALLKIVSHL